MCIIIYKPAGVKMPGKKTIKRCFNNNPDGAGLMYIGPAGVEIRKGFMTYEELQNALQGVDKSGPLVIHCRITTNGGTKKANCHPFPLTNKAAKLKKTKTAASVGIAHNGIIGMTAGAVDMSDTMEFIRDYASRLIQSPDWYKDDKLVDIIGELTSGSRLAVLSSDGHCELIGAGWVCDGGVWYSNDSYKPDKPTTKAKSYDRPTYTGLYSTDYDRGYNDGYYDCMIDYDGTEKLKGWY